METWIVMRELTDAFTHQVVADIAGFYQLGPMRGPVAAREHARRWTLAELIERSEAMDRADAEFLEWWEGQVGKVIEFEKARRAAAARDTLIRAFPVLAGTDAIESGLN